MERLTSIYRNEESKYLRSLFLPGRNYFLICTSTHLNATHINKNGMLHSRTSGILCRQSPLVLVPSRLRLRGPSGSGEENSLGVLWMIYFRIYNDHFMLLDVSSGFMNLTPKESPFLTFSSSVKMDTSFGSVPRLILATLTVFASLQRSGTQKLNILFRL